MSYQSLRNTQGIKRPWDGATFTVGTETSNAIVTEVQLTRNGNPIAEEVLLHGWLSSQANGKNRITTAPTGGMGNNNAQDGDIIFESPDNIGFVALSSDQGRFGVSITDTGTLTFYIAIWTASGHLVVSPAITFA